MKDTMYYYYYPKKTTPAEKFTPAYEVVEVVVAAVDAMVVVVANPWCTLAAYSFSKKSPLQQLHVPSLFYDVVAVEGVSAGEGEQK